MPNGPLPLLCGALLALTLPRPSAWPLGWFALAPLLALWARLPPRRAAASGLWAGAAFHAVALYWVYSTCRFAGVHAAIAAAAWAALAVVLALPWALTAWAGARVVPGLPAAARPWAWAVVWTAIAAAFERWTPRLAVDLLAYTQSPNLPLLQIGALAGPHGLGFLLALFNAALAEAWEEPPGAPRGPSAAANLAAAALLCAAAWGWGWAVLTARVTGGPAVRVEILQPAVDQYQKWDAGSAGRILAGFDELLARPRAAPPSLVVWPESALPRWVEEEGDGLPEAAAWAARHSAFHLVGAVSRGRGGSHCSAILLGPDGRARGIYRKRQLVPFGEFQPVPGLERFVGILSQMGDLEPGEADPPLLDTPLGLAAGSICYEAMFPRWARRDAARGARVIVNVTNDAWYKDTWGPVQHFGANVYRAIENRVTVVRSGNTGISAVVDPWGVVTARLDLNERGRLDAEVPSGDPFPRRSLYARRGDWLGTLCLLAALGLALLAFSRSRAA